ncbi:TMEM175 family protein [Herbiconiux sp. L3-i23]|uniref:TMEM175 family protein n=1 Tax=Herbiconiux sp. L3-i23 TaxID=2905871 RepID=UPI0020589B00|nr:TMEM175 family protein [Herbiconiux sp. L3-i23]BDI21956.1 DUF1211 domain-containing membrane protein [Herbiconiux sp. L3-i23]
MPSEPRTRSHREAYASSRGLDRVVFFTDAIAAIAITLLILPLVDLVPESASDGRSPAEFFADNWPEVFGFGISFLVISRLWYAHHQLFEHVRAYTGRLALLSVAWAFTIVVLPLPTAMTAEFEPSHFTVGFYIGTMLLSSALLTIMTFLIHRNSDIEAPENPVTRRVLIGSVTITSLFALALLIGVLATDVNYWSLFVLLLAGPVGSLLERLLPGQRDVG